MTKNKKCVAVVFGGRSGEHEVSLTSAHGIITHLDPNKYDIQKIGISKEGEWLFFEDQPFEHPGNVGKNKLHTSGVPLTLAMKPSGPFFVRSDGRALPRPDVVFPILHGTYGEDGTIQGLFEMASVPYVGPGVLASSVCMDKELTKRVLVANSLPVGPYTVLHKQIHGRNKDWPQIERELGADLFVKPAKLGSSVGISHTTNEKEFKTALEKAFAYDNKVVVEQKIPGRELECAVLGNYDAKSTLPGEIVPKHDFYSYEAKYIDPDGASLSLPAKLPDGVAERCRKLAVDTFNALQLSGLSRVDFFYNEADNNLIVNEVNTMPGFTPISMYPKLWIHEGLSYEALLDRLIELGEEAYQVAQSKKTDFT